MADPQLVRDKGNEFSRRHMLKACGGSALLLSAAPILSSCGILNSHPSTFDVLARDWLTRMAASIGALPVGKILNGGLTGGWAEWEPEVEVVGENVLEFGAIAAAASFDPGSSGARPEVVTTAAYSGEYRYIPGGLGYAHPIPPVVFMRVSQRPDGHPPTDKLIAFVDHGKKFVVFKPWAWQALSQFVHFLTGANAGADLDVARAVCVLTLIPSGVRPKTGRIPDGLVDWVTYESRNGNVELALVQESNGRPVGIVKASAIPGSDGRPLIKHFVLPKQSPGTV